MMIPRAIRGKQYLACFGCSMLSLPLFHPSCDDSSMERKTIAMRLTAAIVISAFLVTLLTLFFIRLSEAGSGIIEDIGDMAIVLDGTEWDTDREGRKVFSGIFGRELDGTMHIERTGDSTILISFPSAAASAFPGDGCFSASLGGVRFSISASRDHSGAATALYIISGDDVITFFPSV